MVITHELLHKIASFGNAAIALAKLAVAGWTGSAALMANAIHALADTTSLVLMRQSSGSSLDHSAPRDTHFWTHVVAILVYSLAAGVAISQGVERLRNPLSSSPSLHAPAVVVTALLFAVAWRFASNTAHARIPATSPRSSLSRLANAAAIASGLVALLPLAIPSGDAARVVDALASTLIGLITGYVAARSAIELKIVLTAKAHRCPLPIQAHDRMESATNPPPTVAVSASDTQSEDASALDPAHNTAAQPVLSRKQKKRRR